MLLNNMLTVREFAAAADVSESFVRRMIRENDIMNINVISNMYLIDKSELADFKVRHPGGRGGKKPSRQV